MQSRGSKSVVVAVFCALALAPAGCGKGSEDKVLKGPVAELPERISPDLSALTSGGNDRPVFTPQPAGGDGIPASDQQFPSGPAERIEMAISATASGNLQLAENLYRMNVDEAAIQVPQTEAYPSALKQLSYFYAFNRGNNAAAEEITHRLVEAWQTVAGRYSVEASSAMVDLTACLTRQAKYKEALVWYDQAVDILVRQPWNQVSIPRIVEVLTWKADALVNAGRRGEADDLRLEIENIKESTGDFEAFKIIFEQASMNGRMPEQIIPDLPEAPSQPELPTAVSPDDHWTTESRTISEGIMMNFLPAATDTSMNVHVAPGALTTNDLTTETLEAIKP